MRLEITVDETILQELFSSPAGNRERLNIQTRLERHILVGSRELRAEWDQMLEKQMFQQNPGLRELYENWIVDKVTTKKNFKSVNLPEVSKVQGSPTPKEQIVLGTAYESDSKIVVGDYSDELRRANPELRFVKRAGFSQTKPDTITMRQVEQVLEGAGNLKNDLFTIFETPLELIVNENSSSELLARYLSYFYDHKLVIQDKFFVRNSLNEANFNKYILPYIDKDKCEIVLRVAVNRDLASQGSQKKRMYEGMSDYNIKVQCKDENRENLHDGYFESAAYRMRVGHRLSVFGADEKNYSDRINITKR